jgi:hypothetical protein
MDQPVFQADDLLPPLLQQIGALTIERAQLLAQVRQLKQQLQEQESPPQETNGPQRAGLPLSRT